MHAWAQLTIWTSLIVDLIAKKKSNIAAFEG
jgi:hypothetical protein